MDEEARLAREIAELERQLQEGGSKPKKPAKNTRSKPKKTKKKPVVVESSSESESENSESEEERPKKSKKNKKQAKRRDDNNSESEEEPPKKPVRRPRRREPSSSEDTDDTDEELEKKREIDRIKREIEKEKKKAPPPKKKSSKYDEELERLRRELKAMDASSSSDEDPEKAREIAALKRELEKKKERKAEKSKVSTSGMSPSVLREKELDSKLRAKEPASSTSSTAHDREVAELRKKLREMEERSTSTLPSSVTPTMARRREELEMEIAKMRAVVSTTDKSSLAREASYARSVAFKKQFGLDLCFVMDCTGSMGSWIAQAKDKVISIMEKSKDVDNRITPRIAFVGYRDYNSDGTMTSDQYDVVDFNENGSELQTRLGSVGASGGGDGPEDIAGGFEQALGLSWASSTRLIIHIADAPCHGKQYHRYSDSFPSGDPRKKVPEDYLRAMCNRGMEYHFIRINNSTDQMMEIFKGVFTATGRQIIIHNLGDDPSKFLPSVLASIKDTVSRSVAFK